MGSVGRYRLGPEVARGGMGVVHRGVDPDGRAVAIKLLAGAAFAQAEVAQRRFLLEVQALLRLAHPHVVRLLDAGIDEGTPWLALEWVEGETLHTWLRRSGPLEPAAAAILVRDLARAVAACHAQGVVHRDLKPSNVMIRAADAAPLLIDFGLVRDLEAPGPSTTGQMLGTPGYLAPEQVLGERHAIGPATDVWGLGGILFAALTGRAPWVGASVPEMILVARKGEVPPPSRARPGVPAGLDAICRRCLTRDPAGRYPDAAAVAEALEAWLGRPQWRARRALLAGAGLGAAAIGLLAWRGPGAAAAPPPPPSPPPATPATPRSSVAPAPTPPSEPASVGSLIELALRREEPREALADLARAIALDPTSPAPYRERARVRANLGDQEGALADYTRALELGPPSALAYFNRGAAREALGDHAGAVADLGRALELEPDWAEARYQRGTYRFLMGDLPGSLEDLDLAIARAPDHALAHANRGQARGGVGDIEGALADFTRALELDPTLARAWHDRGVARAAVADLAAAEADLSRAIELRSDDPEAFKHRGLVRKRRGDLTGAAADWERFLELAPEHPQARAVRKELAALRAP